MCVCVGVGGGGWGGGTYKIFPLSIYFNGQNGQFYPNLGSSYTSVRKDVFMTVMMGH